MAEQEYQIRNKHMLVVSALLGLVAVVLFLVHDWQIRQENARALVDVVEASKDLTVGDKLGAENTRIDKIPKTLVPVDMFTDLVLLADRNAVYNLELNQDVMAERIIRWSYLTAGGHSATAVVPKPGHRLVPIKVDSKTCPAGLEVGMYVDLVAPVPGMGQAVHIMERVQVKAINNFATRVTVNKIDAVTVEAKVADADNLSAFLYIFKDVTISTRNPEDKAAFVGFNPAVVPILNQPGVKAAPAVERGG